MVFAILAAGEGSRLAQEGFEVPKPLLKINGQIMIERLVGIFMRNRAEKIVVIANNIHQQTHTHLNELINKGIPIELVVKTTPSSMHSFYEIHKKIGQRKFCLTTVDTIFREEEFGNFISTFESSDDDGLMAVTDFIDDERPLYIAHDKNWMITGFYDSLSQYDAKQNVSKHNSVCDVISGGVYCLDATSFPVLEKCIENGMSRMRNFQRQLIAEGLKIRAYKFSKILDVDHVEDIAKAEEFLS